MELMDIIDDILDQENCVLPKKVIEPEPEPDSSEQVIFNKMANFIIGLDPDALYDNQIEEIMDMIDDIEADIIDEMRPLARKSNGNKNQYSKKWYSKNKNEIKRRKQRLARSGQGRKRARMKGRLARAGRTVTGRRKVIYNRRKRYKER
jgi:hypothetical protein